MRVSTVSETVPELRFQPKRSEGVHLSEIIADIAIKLDIFKAGELNPARGALGFAWELYLEKSWCLEKGVFRSDEVFCDGIAGSPDGIGHDEEGPFIGEYKHTYYSTKKEFEDQWYFQAQTKSYCWMLSHQTGELVTRVYMPVMHACGDYTYPLEPKYRERRVDYTFTELETNWKMVTTHAVATGRIKEEEVKSFDVR